jgi:hypothetical protein
MPTKEMHKEKLCRQKGAGANNDLLLVLRYMYM